MHLCLRTTIYTSILLNNARIFNVISSVLKVISQWFEEKREWLKIGKIV